MEPGQRVPASDIGTPAYRPARFLVDQGASRFRSAFGAVYTADTLAACHESVQFAQNRKTHDSAPVNKRDN